MAESRVKKSLLNAKVNLVFYVLTLALSFFSRKIFLDCLGADFVGLTGTLQNLLGFLNLAELGVGAAIGYVLYKPLFENNQRQINEIISVFGYLYRWIGFLILTLGGILACFLPLIFPDTEFEMGIIYAAYFAFLASSLIGYFINYKQTLLGADQKNYVITGYFQSTNIIKILIQMTSAWYTKNYYLWILIEIIFGIIYSFILNWRIRKTYPWLCINLKNSRNLCKKYNIVIIKSKQLFIHKLAGIARFQFIPFIIYIFTSLEVVAQYSNYTLIVDKVAILVENILGSTQASIGNLIAEGSQEKIMGVYWELNTLRYFIAGICTFSIFQLIDPFIILWIGESYILDNTILTLILTNIFLVITRGTNDQFLFGYGLFQDTWAPIVSVIITVVLGLLLGYIFGLKGVLLSNVFGLFIMLFLWKPYFLYSRGFKLKLSLYFIGIFRLIFPIIISWISTSSILNYLDLPKNSFLELIHSSFIIIFIFSSIEFLFMAITNKKNLYKTIRRLNFIKQ